jgi:5-formyltetrahydrofolate cyclo-ligase
MTLVQSGTGRDRVDDVAIEAAKNLLRKAILLRRDLRPPELRRSLDATRFELFRRRLAERRPSVVAAYLSHGAEPGTLQLVAWLASQHIPVLLPVLTSPDGRRREEPTWAPYAGPDALRVGVLSILEPTTAALPANSAGARLGRGGGWYDQALLEASDAAAVCALLFDDEVLNAIPTQPWDQRVGSLVTCTRIIECRPEPSGAGAQHPKA